MMFRFTRMIPPVVVMVAIQGQGWGCITPSDDDDDTGGVPEEMVEVPDGSFWMGCAPHDDDCFDDEYAYHEVTLQTFWIDTYEVTVADAVSFLNAEGNQCGIYPCSEEDPQARHRFDDGEGRWVYDPDHEYFPVTFFTWYGAEAYCWWKGKRLPTEAEWEKAARGTDERIYPWGNEDPDCARVNFEGCGPLQQIGANPGTMSPYGALDMAGSVFEWVDDWYSPEYLPEAVVDPSGPAGGSEKVARGGAFSSPATNLRTSYRGDVSALSGSFAKGLRCAWSE